MKHFVTSLFSKASSSRDIVAEPHGSSLKAAFRQSREKSNIDVVWPVLKAAKLYVVVAAVQGVENFYLTRSPNPERFCVTVSEQLDWLSKVPWPKKEMLGQDLVAAIAPTHEIVVVYPDGGDYVTREHLSWYRQLG